MKLKSLMIAFAAALLLSGSAYSQGTFQLKAFHMLPEAQLDSIDLYASSFGVVLLSLQDLPFGASIPMTTIPFPNVPLDLGVAPGGSSSVNDTLLNIPAQVPANTINIIAGVGVSDPGMYTPNPDGLDISLKPIINPNGRVESQTEGMAEVSVMHGVTDAPTINISVNGGGTVATGLSFGSYSDYAAVTAGPIILDITDTGGNQLVSYQGDLSGLADSAVTIIANGFFDSASQRPERPMLLFAYSAGETAPRVFVPVATGIEHDVDPITVQTYTLNQNYPNPFNPSTTIEFALPSSEKVSLAIYNNQGQLVETLINQNLTAGVHKVRWEAVNLPSGVYYYRIATPNFTQTKKLMLLK